MMATRTPLIAANWKMNTTLEQGLALAKGVLEGLRKASVRGVEVILLPPFTHVDALCRAVAGAEHVHVGAQNCHAEDGGAYTGEVSAAILASVGARYVVLGHSERRHYFHEHSQGLQMKVQAVLRSNLRPLFCCGEGLQVRQEGQQEAFVRAQVEEALFGLEAAAWPELVLAYEPIWAIGTGHSASPAQAQAMHASIRSFLAERYSSALAERLPILYGGSIKANNARVLFACEDVDGGLVGGASLEAEGFVEIVQAAAASQAAKA